MRELRARLAVKIAAGARWASTMAPHYTLAFLAVAVTSELSIERRLVVAGFAMNLVAALFVVAVPLMVGFGLYSLVQRSKGWPYRAYSFALVCTIFSFVLLMVMPGVTASLELDRAMRVSFGRDYVRVSGAIAADLPAAIEKGMADDFQPARVYLANMGGDVQAGQAAAELLRARGVAVAVIDGPCDSACAYMALMFPARYLAAGGELGFHDLHGYNALKQQKQNRQRVALMAKIEAQGIEPDVVQSMFSTKDIVRPSRDALLRDGIITGCWDSLTTTPSPCS